MTSDINYFFADERQTTEALDDSILPTSNNQQTAHTSIHIGDVD